VTELSAVAKELKAEIKTLTAQLKEGATAAKESRKKAKAEKMKATDLLHAAKTAEAAAKQAEKEAERKLALAVAEAEPTLHLAKAGIGPRTSRMGSAAARSLPAGGTVEVVSLIRLSASFQPRKSCTRVRLRPTTRLHRQGAFANLLQR
jgi:cell division septum initiation protein DivIVA